MLSNERRRRKWRVSGAGVCGGACLQAMAPPRCDLWQGIDGEANRNFTLASSASPAAAAAAQHAFFQEGRPSPSADLLTPTCIYCTPLSGGAKPLRPLAAPPRRSAACAACFAGRQSRRLPQHQQQIVPGLTSPQPAPATPGNHRKAATLPPPHTPFGSLHSEAMLASPSHISATVGTVARAAATHVSETLVPASSEVRGRRRSFRMFLFRPTPLYPLACAASPSPPLSADLLEPGVGGGGPQQPGGQPAAVGRAAAGAGAGEAGQECLLHG